MQKEHTFERDLTYSYWHRTCTEHMSDNKESASAIVDWLTAMDVDFFEYCGGCRKPLALMETKKYQGRDRYNSPRDPNVKAMINLSKQCGVPAYVVYYERAKKIRETTTILHEISQFHVQQLGVDKEPIILTPQQWAHKLRHLHFNQCQCDGCKKALSHHESLFK